ncbi:amidohydrolase family protein [Halobacillus shinanisalinarum]|uniref:Amidohydrolase family protein n=1 Tax=Halobacillus shinanisalinarum TaxID=2932258 RepID=A0ABY4GVT5_9BACI|nr:amidohydrolase family protein [Halobacillus shinanisalinarum]UOQ91835.1 amidohydrolase family protein [Halobacillus shinanisalinarum]
MKTAYLVKKLFDGLNEEYKNDVAILVDNEIIQDIVDVDDVPFEYNIHDLGDLFVIPGLFDCHVHLVWNGSSHPKAVMTGETSEMTAVRTAEHARLALLHGITTVRDVGGDYKCVLGVRDAIEQRIIRGSRIIASGNPVIMTGGHVHEFGYEVDGPHEARKGVREMIKRDVDLIKIMASGGIYGKSESPGHPQFTVEEMSVIVEEAHQAGRKVAAHAEGRQGIINALEAGVDTIEHGNLMTEEEAKIMAEKNVFIVPTISTFYYKATFNDQLSGVPDYVMKKVKQIIEGSYNVLRYVKEYNIPIAAGTDDGATCMPHGALFYELELYVHCGLTPFEALMSATSNAAKACGVEKELGTIEPGKKADFIGLKNDPLKDISALREVDTVIKEGKAEKSNAMGLERENNLEHLRVLKTDRILN